jgi:hypothetical protein
VPFVQCAALLNIYAISQEQAMSIDKLTCMHLPDTSPVFKAWLAAETHSNDEEQQQQGYAALIAAAAAVTNGDALGALSGVNSGAATAAGPPASSSSSNPVTPGRNLLTAAGRVAASNGMGPAAAAAPRMFESPVRVHRDDIMAQLSDVFERLSTHMQASSKDSKEKVRHEYEVLFMSWWLFCSTDTLHVC